MGLDAEFHDHCLVFSSKTGVTTFDGLVFHGDICGVNNIFLYLGEYQALRYNGVGTL